MKRKIVAAIFAMATGLTVQVGEAQAQTASPAPVAATARLDQDPLSGTRLYADVERYAAFGMHRFGTEADRDTTDWIAQELEQAGLKVHFQPFSVGKQYFLDAAFVTVKGTKVDALPFWWLPAASASFSMTVPLASEGDAKGRAIWLKLPFDGGAYLTDQHRGAIGAAADRGPVAIIVTVDNPGDEIFAYNVGQDDPAWPVPVIIVGGKHRGLLEAAQRKGAEITIAVNGHYGANVQGRNVVAQLDQGKKKTIVISTPMTGWFTCACERGAGIANFLAMARYLAAAKLDANFIFVATAGHEVGHGGMEVFLEQTPPPLDEVLAWVHFGSANSCYEWVKDASGWTTNKQLETNRTLVSSPSSVGLMKEAFEGVTAKTFVAANAAPGELRDIKKAGYLNFIGIVGRDRFFHTPGDIAIGTGPEILEPMARAFSKAIALIAKRQGEAFH